MKIHENPRIPIEKSREKSRKSMKIHENPRHHIEKSREKLIGRVLGSAVGAENVSLSRIQSFRISDVWKDEIPSHAFLILGTVCVIPK